MREISWLRNRKSVGFPGFFAISFSRIIVELSQFGRGASRNYVTTQGYFPLAGFADNEVLMVSSSSWSTDSS